MYTGNRRAGDRVFLEHNECAVRLIAEGQCRGPALLNDSGLGNGVQNIAGQGSGLPHYQGGAGRHAADQNRAVGIRDEPPVAGPDKGSPAVGDEELDVRHGLARLGVNLAYQKIAVRRILKGDCHHALLPVGGKEHRLGTEGDVVPAGCADFLNDIGPRFQSRPDGGPAGAGGFRPNHRAVRAGCP